MTHLKGPMLQTQFIKNKNHQFLALNIVGWLGYCLTSYVGLYYLGQARHILLVAVARCGDGFCPDIYLKTHLSPLLESFHHHHHLGGPVGLFGVIHDLDCALQHCLLGVV